MSELGCFILLSVVEQEAGHQQGALSWEGSVQWDPGLMLRLCANRASLIPVVCGLRLEYPLTQPP